MPKDLSVIFQSQRKRLQKKSQQKGIRKNLILNGILSPWNPIWGGNFFASVEIQLQLQSSPLLKKFVPLPWKASHGMEPPSLPFPL